MSQPARRGRPAQPDGQQPSRQPRRAMPLSPKNEQKIVDDQLPVHDSMTITDPRDKVFIDPVQVSADSLITTNTAQALSNSTAHLSSPVARRRSQWLNRLLAHRRAMIGLAILALLVVSAIFAPSLIKLCLGWDYASNDFSHLSEPPGPTHWFGSTNVGGDVAAQVFHALQRSLIIAVCVSLAVTGFAAIVGAGAAYLGGWLEKVVLGLIQFLLVIPTFLILMIAAGVANGNWLVLMVVMIATGWMVQARVVWTMSVPLVQKDYVLAARFSGASSWDIIRRHVLVHLSSYLAFSFAMTVVATVSAETTLAFLGFGVRSPDISLGTLLAEGSRTFFSEPWRFIFPALTLTMLTISLAFIAEGVRDVLDPASTTN